MSKVISYGYRKLVDGEVPEMYRFQCSNGKKGAVLGKKQLKEVLFAQFDGFLF